MSGAVRSAGITSTVHDEVLPASSVAVMITVVLVVMIVPDAGVCVSVTDESQLSVAITRLVRFGISALHDSSMGNTWLAGHAITGAVWSVGMIWNVQEVLLPASSVVESVIVVALLITVPEAGDCIIINDASQLSAAAASPE
jgi:hypothetical protein